MNTATKTDPLVAAWETMRDSDRDEALADLESRFYELDEDLTEKRPCLECMAETFCHVQHRDACRDCGYRYPSTAELDAAFAAMDRGMAASSYGF